MEDVHGIAGNWWVKIAKRSSGGRMKVFEKLISADEMRKKTKEYQTFVLEDIFSEEDLKEYMDGIKNIVQKDGECEEG